MKTVLTNTSGQRIEYEEEVKQLENFVTGISYSDDIDSDDMIEKITTAATSNINNIDLNTKLNREQRRKVSKKIGKKGRNEIDIVTDTVRKLNYIDLIQKLRKLNQEKEKEENETTKN